jgi:pyrophosphatase PpaX
MKDYETYLFDIDGTLLDTMELIYQSFRATLVRFSGPELSREHILSHVGIPLITQMEIYLGPLGEREKEILAYHRTYQFSIYKDYLKMFPGVAELLREWKARKKKTGVVTSRTRDSLHKYLSHFGLTEYFDILVTPECTSRAKPDPEPVLYAMEKLGTEPGKTLFLGDASVDILSGCGAGADTAFALWGPNDPEELPREPTWIVNSLSDLLA